MTIERINPTCNLDTVKDGRGAIFTFIPKDPIMEFNLNIVKAGKVRGNHHHPEFDEYILLVNGNGVEVEKNVKTGKETFFQLSKGECIYIPRGTSHVFLAITDCESVSFLTKKWEDCDEPIIHENLGYGEGDHGDPESTFYQERKEEVKGS